MVARRFRSSVQTLKLRQIIRLVTRALLVFLEPQAQLAIAADGYPNLDPEFLRTE